MARGAHESFCEENTDMKEAWGGGVRESERNNYDAKNTAGSTGKGKLILH